MMIMKKVSSYVSVLPHRRTRSNLVHVVPKYICVESVALCLMRCVELPSPCLSSKFFLHWQKFSLVLAGILVLALWLTTCSLSSGPATASTADHPIGDVNDHMLNQDQHERKITQKAADGESCSVDSNTRVLFRPTAGWDMNFTSSCYLFTLWREDAIIMAKCLKLFFPMTDFTRCEKKKGCK